MKQGATLARMCGLGQRIYADVATLAKLGAELGPPVAMQALALLEELDLLRHYMREATLHGVIEAPQRFQAPGAPPPPPKPKAPRRPPPGAQAAGGKARAAKLPPAERKAIASKAARARWGKE